MEWELEVRRPAVSADALARYEISGPEAAAVLARLEAATGRK